MSTGFDVAPWAVRHRLTVTTESHDAIDFVDLTDRVSGLVKEAGLNDGLVVIFTRHTTTGILINEHEPLLLEDLRRLFADLAPGERAYAHDDLRRRTRQCRARTSVATGIRTVGPLFFAPPKRFRSWTARWHWAVGSGCSWWTSIAGSLAS